MDIRTITGTSISEALSEARSLWGDGVVMLQAEPGNPGGMARIAVGVPEGPAQGASPVAVLLQEPASPRAISVAPAPGSMRRGRRADGSLLSDRIRPATEVFARLSSADDGKTNPEPAPQPAAEAQPLAVDPVFMRLIRHGLRPRRARELAELGRSRTSSEAAERLAADLPPAVSGRPPGRVVFVGAPGSGKTSLVVRAAVSRVRAGRTAPTVIVVAPDPARMHAWQDPTPMFESFDLEVIRCSREALASALAGLSGDVLIDTPSGFGPPSRGNLHVRLVVDARSASPATAREGQDADSVVVTHIDQAPALGYLTERLISMKTPVAALVESPGPTDGIRAWNPSTFASELCDG